MNNIKELKESSSLKVVDMFTGREDDITKVLKNSKLKVTAADNKIKRLDKDLLKELIIKRNVN